MKLTAISIDFDQFPIEYHPLLHGAQLYDSSSSEDAKVYFIEKDDGYFLKTAAAGSLMHEKEMTQYFHQKSLATEVLSYISLEKDWLLTRKIHGNDCVHPEYLAQPERLCDTLAEILFQLHQLDTTGCPRPDYTANYLDTAKQNHEKGLFDSRRGFDSPQKAWEVVEKNHHLLKADTLIHGDYCLPNIILNDWKFSAFIDVDHGGIGDRHIDIFWALWSLNYNLKTDRYGSRFIDAYGKQLVNPETLRLISAIEAFG